MLWFRFAHKHFSNWTVLMERFFVLYMRLFCGIYMNMIAVNFRYNEPFSTFLDVVNGDMSSDETVNVRLPTELLKRAEALVAELEKDSQLRVMGRVSRSTVLRLAVWKGIEALEAAYQPSKLQPRGKR